jgi:hypothetical protein
MIEVYRENGDRGDSFYLTDRSNTIHTWIGTRLGYRSRWIGRWEYQGDPRQYLLSGGHVHLSSPLTFLVVVGKSVEQAWTIGLTSGGSFYCELK